MIETAELETTMIRMAAIAGVGVMLAACTVSGSELAAGSGEAAGVAVPSTAAAGPDVSGQPSDTVSGEQAFNAECSACHMAYPPGLLPARSWQAIVGNLADHFGEDASLDAETTRKVGEYLVANAAESTGQGRWVLRGLADDQVPLRITDMQWWKRAHYEVRPSAFTSPEVVSRSNCLACHRSGASGEGGYDD